MSKTDVFVVTIKDVSYTVVREIDGSYRPRVSIYPQPARTSEATRIRRAISDKHRDMVGA